LLLGRPSVVATGISIHIGVNRVDPTGYGGWEGGHRGCENDAAAMARIAEGAGFATQLLTQEATSVETIAALNRATDALQDGDFLLMSFSGYGGRVGAFDSSNPRLGDTWALYDRQLILEVELFSALRRLASGTRILVVADTCVQLSVPRAMNGLPWEAPAEKWLPHDVLGDAYAAQREVYDGILGAQTEIGGGSDEPALVVFHSCMPYQAALDGDPYSVFTEGFLNVWKRGGFRNYRQLQRRLSSYLPPTQTPELTTVGELGAALAGQRPFAL
jgi:hypothetical protein